MKKNMHQTRTCRGGGRLRRAGSTAAVAAALLALTGTTIGTASASAVTPPGSTIATEATEDRKKGSSSQALKKFLAQADVVQLRERAAAERGLPADSPALGAVTASGPMEDMDEFEKMLYEKAKNMGKDLFGQLGGVVGGTVGDFLYKSILEGFGFDTSTGPDPVMEAFAQVNQSLELLQKQTQQLLANLEDVQNDVNWGAFVALDQELQTTLSNVQWVADSFGLFVAYDIRPTDQTLISAMETLDRAMYEIDTQAAHHDSGSIPALMKAYDRKVTNGDDLWKAIEEYRDHVRSNVARAIITMEIIDDHWGEDFPEFETRRVNAAKKAIKIGEDMYQHGVRPPTPSNGPAIQAKGGAYAISAHGNGAKGWSLTTQGSPTHPAVVELENTLRNIADNYRPAEHGGKSLERYLLDNDMPTKFSFPGTAKIDEIRGSGTLDRWVDMQVRYRVAEVSGNSFSTGWRDYGERKTRVYQESWAPFIGWGIKSGHESKRDAGLWAMNIPKGQCETAMSHGNIDGFRAKFYVASTNGTFKNGASGFLTDLRADAIREAAFPGSKS